MRRRSHDRAGWHDGAGWRGLTWLAVYSALLGVVAIWLELRVFATMCLAISGMGAFTGGYCFRQQVISTGRLPRFRWLWLKEDLTEPPD